MSRRRKPCQSERRGVNTLLQMRHRPSVHRLQEVLVSHFRSGDAMRSRSVSGVVLTATVDIPASPARLKADWQREMVVQMGLEPGDVEALPLARARARWPDYRRCVAAASGWLHRLGLADALAGSDTTLMACRGARYHHDGAQYGGAAFCNLFLSEDSGLDLHFPFAGHRIPLVRGTVVVFDTCQPHAVVERGSDRFDVADFPPERDCSQVFLTWELPIENDSIGKALQIAFDIDPSTCNVRDEGQVWFNGARASVCPDSGRWIRGDL